MTRIALVVTVFLAFVPPSFAQSSRTFTVDDLLAVKRVSDPQVSPDGKWVAYTVGTVDLEKNKVVSHVWVVSSEGGEPRQLTNGEKGESRPRWSPDGKCLAFTTSRSGASQIWVLPMEGGEAWQLTDISTGASDHIWSPTGKMLAFASEVYPDCPDDEGNKKRAEEIEKSGIQAKTIDRLLYRHWSSWKDGKRNHTFVVPFDAQTRRTQRARDLTPGDHDAPPFSLGGPDPYAFSPDGQELAYTRGPDPTVEAWSTNADVCVVPVEGGASKNLTEENRGWDGSPAYSPDGRYIALRSQERDGFESDLFRLHVIDRKQGGARRLCPELQDGVEELVWTPDSSRLVIVAENQGRRAIWVVLADPAERQRTCQGPFFDGANFSGICPPQQVGTVGIVSSLGRPAEVAVVGRWSEADKAALLKRLTRTNDALLASRQMPTSESVSFEGARGAKIQAWLVRPPNFEKGKRYPFLLWIHGGPQGAWMDGWSYRWNPMICASAGYVVLMPNPHGSTGFGHEFTEQISGDWAGACYEDLMRGVDWAIAQGIADPERMGAMGGSFGGYMVNWILGHTDRFKALVSHCGVYNLESMYGATEELWFPEWDLRGMPWDDREGNYARFSPHRFASGFKTPTLVIHGELDFRVPLGEGLQLFTALQRQGVPSRLLYFPDEGHWVLKPRNSRLWNETVLAWLDRYVKAGAESRNSGGGGR